MLDFKKNPVSTTLFMLGLLLIAIGAGINFYNEMFKDEEAEENKTAERRITEVIKPTNMEAVSTRINKDLGHFLLYKYDPNTDSGIDLLSNSRKRLDLVNSVLEVSGNISFEPIVYFPYVSERDYKNEYIKVYGSDDKYTTDMQAYNEKPIVDGALGVGYIGWNAIWGDVNIERTLTAKFVDSEENNHLYTISGTYSDTQAGSEVSSGTFIITYYNDGETSYIVNIILNKIS